MIEPQFTELSDVPVDVLLAHLRELYAALNASLEDCNDRAAAAARRCIARAEAELSHREDC